MAGRAGDASGGRQGGVKEDKLAQSGRIKRGIRGQTGRYLGGWRRRGEDTRKMTLEKAERGCHESHAEESGLQPEAWLDDVRRM
jgi:hypothetical protein